MSLNRPALTLGPGDDGAKRARDLVSSVCVAIGRPELRESAELGVSELVSNAVMHGRDPIEVRVRGTRVHPRVEVRDGSAQRPVPPPIGAATDDDLMLTFGRGLSLVSRASVAWGADIEQDGKVVWFCPAAELSEGPGVEGRFTGHVEVPEPRTDRGDLVEIRVLDVPLDLFRGFANHFRELRREVRLLAVAHAENYPLAATLSDLFTALERQLRDGIGQEQLAEALAVGASRADVDVRIPPSAAGTLGRFLELLEVADEFCRQERLLALARTPEQVRFQRWFLGEFLGQAAGASPRPWPSDNGHAVH
ncbi:MAG: ATP-binding protein [Nocardioides sp.]|uniref:ATP-binding protein n=1 Tax=Nocardioides sp. TaxID=35761 RepID=UPI0039E31902